MKDIICCAMWLACDTLFTVGVIYVVIQLVE